MEITKDNLGLAIIGLRQCAKEHERDITSTGRIVVSAMCRDVADYLEKIQGASEQKSIDIDKACEWFIKNWVTYINPTTNTVIPAYNFAQAFRKAMESIQIKED